MTDHRILTACRLCQGPIELRLDLGETPLANEYATEPGQQQDTFPLRMVECQSCGHFQLDCVVSPERMFREYAYQSGTTETFRKHLSDLAEQCAYYLSPGDLVVDIASNDGTFLSCLDGSGVKCIGVEPAGNLVARANAVTEVNTVHAFFTKALAEKTRSYHPNGARLITALNVMAHIDNIHDVLEGVKLLLADDGRFIIEVGYLPDVTANGLLGTVYHEHLDYWTVRPLRRLLREHRLTPIDEYTVDSQGGSIRMTCVHSPGPVLARGMPEMPAHVEHLQRAILNRRMSVTDRIRQLRSEGKRIAGYGAPAKLTTLCYALGVERADLECIFDDNPLKVGKFTPGKHIPIVSSSELRERAPDVLVLFSSNFEQEIREKTGFAGEWIVV